MLSPAALRTAGPPLLLVLLVALVTVAEPHFFSGTALSVVTAQALPLFLLGLGQMFVILTGGIDLSVATVCSLGTVILAQTIGATGPLAILITVIATAAIGAVTGFLTTLGQVPSFVVSLGALGFWGAVAQALSGSTTIYIDKHYDAIYWLSSWTFLDIPAAVWIGIVIGIVIWAFMSRHPRGNVFHLVGLGERPAMLSGIPTRRIRVAAFALSGLFSGLAAVVLSAQQQSAAPQLADALLLPAIAAVLVGGCAITGGIGSAFKVAVGALIVTILRVGGAVTGIDPNYQQIVYGGVVIVIVVLTLDRSKLTIIK
ncbi:ABC transporter permease [Tsukamurella soli]